MRRNKYLLIAVSFIILLTLIVTPFVHSEEYPEINLELIGGDSNGIVYGDLILPETVEGIDGAISWTAKNENLIEIADGKGKILKYNVGQTIATSVTATVAGGSSKEIPFSIGYRPDANSATEVFGEDFEGSSFSGAASTTRGSYEHKDGRLVFTRSAENAASGSSAFLYTLDEAYSGLCTFEFTVGALDSIGEMMLSLPLTSNQSSAVVYIRIPSSGEVRAFNGKEQISKLCTVSSRENINIKIELNTETQTYNLHVNGEKIAENFGFYNTTDSIKRIRFWTGSGTSAVGSFTLDDIKISIPSEMFSDIPRKLLNGGSDASDAVGDLYLPETTLGSFEIAWESLEGNIEIDGSYGRIKGSYTEKTSDTLTATCEINGVTYVKEYYFSIPVSTIPKPKKDASGREIINTYYDFTSFDLGSIVTSSAFGETEMSIEDGKFIVNKTGTGGGDNNVMIPVAVPSAFAGTNMVMEFELTTESDNRVTISPTNRHANNGRFGNIRISGSSVTIEECDTSLESYSEKSNGKNTEVYSSFDTGRAFKFVIKMTQTENKDDARWSMWINGKRVADKLLCRYPGYAQTMTYLKFSNGSASVNKLTIDNFKVYEAETLPVEHVEAVLDAIDSISDIAEVDSESGEVIGGLSVGESECTVEFSDSKGLVLPDGSVDFSTHKTTDVITISASYDGYTEEKEIVATIASNYCLGEVTLEGLDLGSYLIAAIPTEVRREERTDEKVKVVLSVYENTGDVLNLICEEASKEQTVTVDGENYGLVGYIEDLPDTMPENPVVKLTVLSSSDDYTEPVTSLTVYGE